MSSILNVTSGQTVTDVVLPGVYDGAFYNEMFVGVGATAVDTVVVAGGSDQVTGTALGSVIADGGTETVNGVSWYAAVDSGGKQNVSYGGAAVSAFISSGGIQTVSGIHQGGEIAFTISALTSNTEVGWGGTEVVSSYGVESGTQVLAGGILVLDGGGIGIGNTYVYGVENVESGGLASANTNVVDQGSLNILSGGTDDGGIVGGQSGEDPTIVVSSGGFDSGTVVETDGAVVVLSGGTASGVLLTFVGSEVVAGGVAVATVARYGGIVYVNRGETIGTMLSGGLEQVNGLASSTQVGSGGTQEILGGGVESGSVVSSGGLLSVYSGGTGNGNTYALSGGHIVVSSSGLLTGNPNIVAGGELTVLSGGAARGGFAAGGTIVVSGGGSDTATVVLSSTGLEFIASAGVVSGGTVKSGGTIDVASGGEVTGGLTISSGGIAIISGSANAGQTVGFAGAGALELPNTANFAAAISGFGLGDQIDLLGFPYGSAESLSYSQNGATGTLSVLDGVQKASFTMVGQYSLNEFALTAGPGTEVKFK
jgi:autotransporter passenger strand-loop-strand repeat protein